MRVASGALVSMIIGALATVSCGGPCAFALVSKIPFSSDPKDLLDQPHPVPCCGGFSFQDVDLSSADIRQIDIANGQVNDGRVDAFLTAPDCTKLFGSDYAGDVSRAQCRIYIGPIAAGRVSERQAIPKGKYRLFAQSWASNGTANVFSIDIGLWTDECRPALTAPSR